MFRILTRLCGRSNNDWGYKFVACPGEIKEGILTTAQRSMEEFTAARRRCLLLLTSLFYVTCNVSTLKNTDVDLSGVEKDAADITGEITHAGAFGLSVKFDKSCVLDPAANVLTLTAPGKVEKLDLVPDAPLIITGETLVYKYEVLSSEHATKMVKFTVSPMYPSSERCLSVRECCDNILSTPKLFDYMQNFFTANDPELNQWIALIYSNILRSPVHDKVEGNQWLANMFGVASMRVQLFAMQSLFFDEDGTSHIDEGDAVDIGDRGIAAATLLLIQQLQLEEHFVELLNNEHAEIRGLAKKVLRVVLNVPGIEVSDEVVLVKCLSSEKPEIVLRALTEINKLAALPATVDFLVTECSIIIKLGWMIRRMLEGASSESTNLLILQAGNTLLSLLQTEAAVKEFLASVENINSETGDRILLNSAGRRVLLGDYHFVTNVL